MKSLEKFTIIQLEYASMFMLMQQLPVTIGKVKGKFKLFIILLFQLFCSLLRLWYDHVLEFLPVVAGNIASSSQRQVLTVGPFFIVHVTFLKFSLVLAPVIFRSKFDCSSFSYFIVLQSPAHDQFCLNYVKITREPQIKTIMRYYLTPVRITIIKKSTNNKCWTASEEKGTLLCFGECKLVQSLRKTVWRFFNKLKRELPHDPAIQLLHIYPKQTKTLI